MRNCLNDWMKNEEIPQWEAEKSDFYFELVSAISTIVQKHRMQTRDKTTECTKETKPLI